MAHTCRSATSPRIVARTNIADTRSIVPVCASQQYQQCRGHRHYFRDCTDAVCGTRSIIAGSSRVQAIILPALYRQQALFNRPFTGRPLLWYHRTHVLRAVRISLLAFAILTPSAFWLGAPPANPQHPRLHGVTSLLVISLLFHHFVSPTSNLSDVEPIMHPLLQRPPLKPRPLMRQKPQEKSHKEPTSYVSLTYYVRVHGFR